MTELTIGATLLVLAKVEAGAAGAFGSADLELPARVDGGFFSILDQSHRPEPTATKTTAIPKKSRNFIRSERLLPATTGYSMKPKSELEKRLRFGKIRPRLPTSTPNHFASVAEY